MAENGTANGNGADNKWIGKRTIRPDGADKVTGRAAYGADFTMPGMLHGRVLRSPHPHARIKSINFDKALALPGVKAVMSAADLVARMLGDIPVGVVMALIGAPFFVLLLARSRVRYEL